MFVHKQVEKSEVGEDFLQKAMAGCCFFGCRLRKKTCGSFEANLRHSFAFFSVEIAELGIVKVHPQGWTLTPGLELQKQPVFLMAVSTG